MTDRQRHLDIRIFFYILIIRTIIIIINYQRFFSLILIIVVQDVFEVGMCSINKNNSQLKTGVFFNIYICFLSSWLSIYQKFSLSLSLLLFVMKMQEIMMMMMMMVKRQKSSSHGWLIIDWLNEMK